MNKHCNKCSNSDQLYMLQKCKHIFCMKCLYYFVNKVNGCNIKCPNNYCFQNIIESDIKKFLPNDSIKKYKKKCITKDCPFIYITDKDFIFQCEFCKEVCSSFKKRHMPTIAECEDTKTNCNKANKRKSEKENFDDLISDFVGFECPICKDFYYPKSESLVRTRQYEFCLKCLNRSMESIKTFDHSLCLTENCGFELVPVEVVKFVGLSLSKKLITKAIQPKQFCCKTKDCKGSWNYEDRRKIYLCSLCEKINCFDCGAIHEGETCKEFQKTFDQKVLMAIVEKITKNRLITCHCGNLLFQESKSGALYCDDCYNYICVFTGKLAGKFGNEGCGCTVKKPCDEKCLYGCFPKYEPFK